MNHWRFIDIGRAIPVDENAERAATGLAIVNATNARSVLADVARIYDRRLARVVTMAADIVGTDGPAEWGMAWDSGDHRGVVMGAAQRIAKLRFGSGETEEWLHQLVGARLCATYEPWLAQRLAVADDARQAIRTGLTRLGDLGVRTDLITGADCVQSAHQRLVLAAVDRWADVMAHGSEIEMTEALLRLGQRVGLPASQLGARIAERMLNGAGDG